MKNITPSSAAPGGTVATTPSPAQLQPAAGAPGKIILPADIDGLEAYMGQLARAEVGFECGLTFTRMMQGACLAELRKLHGNSNRGNPSFRNSPKNLENWADYVSRKFGFSDETARARIEMWEAGKPRLKKLAEDAAAGLSAIFERPISSLSEQEFEVVQQVTHKLTDGKTVRMIQEELGLFKGDAQKPRGGARTSKKPKLTPEEILALDKQDAEESCQHFIRTLDAYFAQNRHTLLVKDSRKTFAAILRQAAQKLEEVK